MLDTKFCKTGKHEMKTLFILVLMLFSLSGQTQIPAEYATKRLMRVLRKEVRQTSPKEWELLENTSSGAFLRLEGEEKYYLYVGRVNTCRSGGCNYINSTSTAFEYFDYAIIMDQNISIKRVVIFNYQSSRGFEICSKAWLKQFNAYDGRDTLLVGEDIDAISGATYSVNAITNDIVVRMRDLLLLLP